MEIPVINIGNSKGIRLSKVLLDKYHIKDKIELILEKGFIVIKPVEEPRKGWESAFKKMHTKKDDELLIDDVLEDEDFEAWM